VTFGSTHYGAAARLFEHLRDGVRDGGSKPMRGSRVLRTTLRTIHLISVGALYGGHVFGVEKERLLPAFVAVLASGFVFVLFEVLRSPIWLVQLRGVATYLKLALLMSVEVFWEQRVLILTAVLAIGTVVSHMPGRYRYYSLLHGREMRGGDRG
jgi:hypothetical protein